eukprot:CAMPEP_0118710996 /NCGR_PEP_ID=MMETSP0800-20121206/23771_1 /TAXON_ID=210618 ORGANISM="Striatella unipunctata, Strain CCMP2910" /NCGR_SAMPLE_ID=MMETSP0800 /ASSEMBLY_ACC=CAM_ASM_000638 /LENGTH=159 /DNA_ID=CAMNT_0006615399 /DNA_START=928 /DNA_END=1404 /DNA_ORIENTATION=+
MTCEVSRNFCENVQVRDTSLYSVFPDLKEIKVSNEFAASDVSPFDCNNETTVSSYYSSFSPFGPAITMSLNQQVSNPVLFVGLSGSILRGSVRLTFSQDVCPIKGATAATRSEVVVEGAELVEIGFIRNYKVAAIAVLGVMDTIGFHASAPVPFISVGW